MNINELAKKINKDDLFETFSELYGQNVYEIQKKRYLDLLIKFKKYFSTEDITIVSSPGRTELGGNHTDHNHGRVLAASIQLDSIAVIAKRNDNLINVISDGFPEPFSVNTGKLTMNKNYDDSSTALIRGIATIFLSEGYNIGGFDTYISSDVLVGSGLSSSASFEILIGKTLSILYNKDSVDSVTLAKIGQKAENIFLEKPCGLMDQVACAHGGIVAIDFIEPAMPVIESIDYSFEANGYQLLVIDTGGDHADLTEDYASIPGEMKSVARFFGHDVCRSVNKNEFIEKITLLTNSLGDRAVLRALHFFNEDNRVVEMVKELRNNNLELYLKHVRESGDSSFKFLQNVFTTRHVTEQKISLAIALTESFQNFQGVVRVHGGGFAGTVQVYIKSEYYVAFKEYIEGFFGLASVTPLRIRKTGAIKVI